MARLQAVAYAVLAAIFCTVLAPRIQAQAAATFGEVVVLGGMPSDMVLDESRHRLYLVNSTAARVDVYDYGVKTVLGSIPVGQRPLGATISANSAFLYVANRDDSTLSVIDLNASGLGTVVNTIPLPARPQGVETELGGRVLICTEGSGTGGSSNTLLIYDPSMSMGTAVQAVLFPPPPATPPSLQPIVARPSTNINGRLRRTPDGKYIVGVNSINNNASTIAYVYETASGTVLRSRTVVGQSSTLSVSQDGLSFMAGFTLYDMQTLNVLGQQSTANAPFTMSGTFTAATNIGASVFSPDGATLYSGFNTTPQTTPLLLISDPRSLGIQLGIRLPESIVDRMVMTADGADVWCLSPSGVMRLPVSKLYTYPILMPESTQVFLAQDDCNPGVAQTALRINNAGGGTLTFAVPQTIPGGVAALVVTASSGKAPANVTFSMDPGRSGVVRVPGTNIYTGGGASNTGNAVNIVLSSQNAINIPPSIRVYMNYRDSTMRGLVYPIPTAPNSTAAAYEGLHDIVLDEARHRVYITNSGFNRIEVFDTQKLEFEAPIPVGQLPHQMALGLDGSTLYVAATGGETIAVVDLDSKKVVDRIVFPPIPRNATAALVSVRAMALGVYGLQVLTSNGNLWKVVDRYAVPRQATAITGVTATGAQVPIAGPTQTMLASSDGFSALLLGGNGTVYRYDGLYDEYSASAQRFTTPITGYYGPLGVTPGAGFLLANGLVLNNSLTVIGGAASPGQPSVSPTGSVALKELRNVAAVAPVSQDIFVRLTTPVRSSPTATITDDIHTTLEAVDVRTGATVTASRFPENPVFSLFGSARTPMPARQMVVDPNGTVYALTLSGLSVVPLAPASSSTQPRIPGIGSIVNAGDGTTRLRPGSLMKITGENLAWAATADPLVGQSVLGGSCVLLNGVSIPLVSTSPGQITAQIPASARPGSNVLQVRSLATAQQGNRVVVQIDKRSILSQHDVPWEGF